MVHLPPGTGDVQLSPSQQAHIMGAVIVTTLQAAAVLDVPKAIRRFQTVQVPILGVVENMAWFTPPGSTERHEVFGRGGGARIEQEFGVPLPGQFPIEWAVREGGDRCRPIVQSDPDGGGARAFTTLAGQVAAGISIVNSS